MYANYLVFETKHSFQNNLFIDIFADIYLYYFVISIIKKIYIKKNSKVGNQIKTKNPFFIFEN